MPDKLREPFPNNVDALVMPLIHELSVKRGDRAAMPTRIATNQDRLIAQELALSALLDQSESQTSSLPEHHH